MVVAALLIVPFPESLWYCALGLILLTLAILDFEHLWLPTVPVVMVVVTGLIHGLSISPYIFENRLIGAAGGFVIFEAIRLVYRYIRKRDGMGEGDPRLLAALGAWTGWMPLPYLVLAACLAGMTWAILSHAKFRKIEGNLALPLGTLLVIAGYPAALIAFWQ
jgi:leader peptidase (prepilin peptidase) / N-methyltransferase